MPNKKAQIVKKTLSNKAKATKGVTKPIVKHEPPVSNTKVLKRLVKYADLEAELKPFKADAKKGTLAQGHTCTCHTNKKNKETHAPIVEREMPKKKRCYNCGSTSHLILNCKKNLLYKPMTKNVWIPKGITNPQGPITK